MPLSRREQEQPNCFALILRQSPTASPMHGAKRVLRTVIPLARRKGIEPNSFAVVLRQTTTAQLVHRAQPKLLDGISRIERKL